MKLEEPNWRERVHQVNEKVKKREVAIKMSRPKSRLEEVRERNEMARRDGLAIVARGRHDRRHNGAKGTTKKEREDWMNLMSKDS